MCQPNQTQVNFRLSDELLTELKAAVSELSQVETEDMTNSFAAKYAVKHFMKLQRTSPSKPVIRN